MSLATQTGKGTAVIVTIPSLHNDAYWQAMERNRQAMIPHLSSNVPASRYRTGLTH
ncbi:hypothetical protein [Enterobacter cloacae]|uniref:hypothetical protein n=1 Tax=Enterobacter cloacae TaxID=550 RepID=UPI001F12625B|nr:hypothetical protein [Enterobacter cloacae]